MYSNCCYKCASPCVPTQSMLTLKTAFAMRKPHAQCLRPCAAVILTLAGHVAILCLFVRWWTCWLHISVVVRLGCLVVLVLARQCSSWSSSTTLPRLMVRAFSAAFATHVVAMPIASAPMVLLILQQILCPRWCPLYCRCGHIQQLQAGHDIIPDAECLNPCLPWQVVSLCLLVLGSEPVRVMICTEK